jgi:hypothetical protein
VSETQAAELRGKDRRDQDELARAPALMRLLWADPQFMPEHLAIWSLRYFGPRAQREVDGLRAGHPEAEPAELQSLAIQRRTRVAVTEGAFVGGPFIVLIPVAFCAALLTQAQMALELAALNGYAPDDEMRAADLLVIQGAYPSTDEAGVALAAMTRDPKQREGKRLPPGTRIAMIRRMAFMLGVLGASDEKRGWFRSALGWAGLGLVVLVGLVLPLVWMPYMALAVRRSSRTMARRASTFYAERRSIESGVTVERAPEVHVAVSGALVRMLGLIVVPIAVALIALVTGSDLGTGKLLSAVILLIVVGWLVAVAWLGYRWWRRRR